MTDISFCSAAFAVRAKSFIFMGILT
jgi:hypothetical protein